ncbi:MAG: L-aspartate oxidase [Candidatus Cloacimonadota bacterium]|nr:L-aspartate oxidase [Candidatus Cloacimonadota bacterium]
MKKVDFLVIGSGIAGLIYALKVSEIGSVVIITKKSLTDCNTEYAQGGIAAVLDKQDKFENHIKDTFEAGSELGKKEIIKKIVQDGPNIIKYLIDIGAEFTKSTANHRNIENLSLTKEGGHSQKRVAYAADSTGHEIMRALISAVKNKKNIEIYENHLAVDLITQHHISQEDEFIPSITCWGAYVLNIIDNSVITIQAKKTMVATGGGSQVYINNTNSIVATGDGLAMTSLAGARLANMEFIQFHPSYFYTTEGNGFLISEALRGEGAVIKLQDGSAFLKKYHKLGSLAPRDVVSKAIEFEMVKRGEKYVYLDATQVDKSILKNHFPYIDKKCREHGLDFTKDFIPIVPAAHYFCGGILTTIDGKTDITNLFAAGEVACTGFHGANRLASNSLLEGSVLAYNASKHPANNDDVDFPKIPEWTDVKEFNEKEWIIIQQNRDIIKRIMQGYVGISRSRRLLKYAQKRIHNIWIEIDNFYQHNFVKKEVIETRNLAIVASKIIQSALIRKESRGLHSIVEYPEQDNEHCKKDTIV